MLLHNCLVFWYELLFSRKHVQIFNHVIPTQCILPANSAILAPCKQTKITYQAEVVWIECLGVVVWPEILQLMVCELLFIGRDASLRHIPPLIGRRRLLSKRRHPSSTTNQSPHPEPVIEGLTLSMALLHSVSSIVVIQAAVGPPQMKVR